MDQNIQVRENSASVLERDNTRRSLKKYEYERMYPWSKGDKQHYLPICWFWPGVWDIFEKEGKWKKGCVNIEDWCFSVHFAMWFQENFIYILHLCLAKILQNGAKFIQKLTPGFKHHMRQLDIGQLQTSSGKSKKLKFDGLLLFKKYIHMAKSLYA